MLTARLKKEKMRGWEHSDRKKKAQKYVGKKKKREGRSQRVNGTAKRQDRWEAAAAKVRRIRIATRKKTLTQTPSRKKKRLQCMVSRHFTSVQLPFP